MRLLDRSLNKDLVVSVQVDRHLEDLAEATQVALVVLFLVGVDVFAYESSE